jgi:hypothetical protein
MIHVLNDYCKVQLDSTGPLSAKRGDAGTDGILVELPKQLTHFGAHSYIVEASWMDREKLEELLTYWKQFIGKRVFWLALQEKGAILQEEDGTRYAYIKLSSLIGWSEPDIHAESVLDAHGGAFSV